MYSKKPTDYKSVVDNYRYGKEAYKKASEQRAAKSCSEFAYTNTGFKAVYDNSGDRENLLFFSVPYSSGFSAFVNGVATEVEEVNTGFMAIKIPADTKCEIVFDYETPGFATGVKISILAFCALVVYVSALFGYKHFKKRNLANNSNISLKSKNNK